MQAIRVNSLQLLVANDYKNQRATTFPVFGGGYPEVNLGQAGKIFNISKLDEVHR